MGSVLVTPSKLISELVITHLNLWHILETAYDKTASDAEVGKAKRKICQLNAKRVKLENEIDEDFLNWMKGKDLYEFIPVLKDYGKNATTKEDTG